MTAIAQFGSSFPEVSVVSGNGSVVIGVVDSGVGVVAGGTSL